MALAACAPDVDINGTFATNGPAASNVPLSRVLYCYIVGIETRDGISTKLMGTVLMDFIVCGYVCVFVCLLVYGM